MCIVAWELGPGGIKGQLSMHSNCCWDLFFP